MEFNNTLLCALIIYRNKSEFLNPPADLDKTHLTRQNTMVIITKVNTFAPPKTILCYIPIRLCPSITCVCRIAGSISISARSESMSSLSWCAKNISDRMRSSHLDVYKWFTLKVHSTNKRKVSHTHTHISQCTFISFSIFS